MCRKRIAITFLILLGFSITNIKSQDVENIPDTNAQSKKESLNEYSVNFSNYSIKLINTLNKSMERYSNKSLEYDLFSKRALYLKVSSQFVGIFFAAYLDQEKVKNVSWIVWGFSGGVPLIIETVEKLIGDWHEKSKKYHSLFNECRDLITEVELESNYIPRTLPNDTDDALKLLYDTQVSWKDTYIRITQKDPDIKTDKELKGRGDDLLPMKPPSLWDIPLPF